MCNGAFSTFVAIRRHRFGRSEIVRSFGNAAAFFKGD